VIAAEGEQKASRALREASEVIGDSPAALQLRYLQTLKSISGYNSTIIFPLPLDICSYFSKAMEAMESTNPPPTLNTISAEKNSTIVFPLPIDLLTYFVRAKEHREHAS
ncbi:hypothetical protein J6590_107012, partial [Homalodisca vitripennis]